MHSFLQPVFNCQRPYDKILENNGATGMVEVSGIEPLASCLQSRCSPN